MYKDGGIIAVVELGITLLAIIVIGYIIYLHRERRERARLREKQLKIIKWLKKKFQGEK